jgi:hypothetical protein
MKKITRFTYLNQGTTYSGTLDGHLNRGQIQMALLAQKKGCANIWGIEHVSVPLA